MVEDIRRVVKGRWRRLGESVATEGVSIDSRTAGAGSLFVALRGQRFDGHDFLVQAAAAGCVSAIVDRDAPLDEEVMSGFTGGVIGTADTTAALGDLAAYHRGSLVATVVAVTGSNGKTTVKNMIHHILSKRLTGSAAPASYNNAVGVPMTLLSADAKDDYIICEVGTNAPGEVAGLARIIRPDVAVITSVSCAHLSGLGDLEHVAAEKAALVGWLTPSGIAIIWSDSKPLASAMRAYDVRVIRFGADESAELRLTRYEPVPGGGRFELNGRLWVNLSVPGRHNALNALAAIAVARRLGLDTDVAATAIGDYMGQEMRLEPIKAGGVTIINDAYNSNPASMLAGAEALASFPGKRRVVVAGDMLELGPQSEALHLQTGSAMAKVGVDLVIGVGSMGRHIAAGAAAGNIETEEIKSVRLACKNLPGMLKRGDVVLLKGSRLTAMERLIAPIQAAFEKTRKGGRTVKSPRRLARGGKKRKVRKC